MKDPYYKRLANNDKKSFWNIFKGVPSSPEFKDLFEKTTRKEPHERLTIEEIYIHKWLQMEKLEEKDLKEEISRRFETIEKSGALDFENSN